MLSDRERRFLDERRVAHLATADAGAVPHVVPVCFAIHASTLYIAIDAKPKRAPAAALKRVKNILENPAVAIVVDRYDEDWTRLGWVMLRGQAEILAAATPSSRPCRSPTSPSSRCASPASPAGAICKLSSRALCPGPSQPRMPEQEACWIPATNAGMTRDLSAHGDH